MFAASLAIAQAPVRSKALRAAYVALRVVSAMATIATAATMTVKIAAMILRSIPRDVSL